MIVVRRGVMRHQRRERNPGKFEISIDFPCGRR